MNGLPLPVANLELGPAVVAGGGTRWEVCLTGSEEFHRVAFGLIAPLAPTTRDLPRPGRAPAPHRRTQRPRTPPGLRRSRVPRRAPPDALDVWRSLALSPLW